MGILHRAGRGAAGGPKCTELTSVCVLSAPSCRDQRWALVSMGGLKAAKASAAGGDADGPLSQLVELILTVRQTCDNAVFTCSVDRKRVWESIQRAHHTD